MNIYQSKFQLSYDCNDCGMKFDNSKQLANHVKKFCVYSGYNSLEGLIEKQVKDIKYDKVDLNKSNLQGYGNHTLGQMKALITRDNQKNNLTENALRNRQQQLIDDLMKFKQKQLNNLKPLYERTFIRNSKAQNQNISPQSGSIEKNIKSMSQEERWQYAERKIRQLEDIKASYIENGGNDIYFLSHLEQLYKFYVSIKTNKNISQMRLGTPINKLQNLDTTYDRKLNSSKVINKFQQHQQNTKTKLYPTRFNEQGVNTEPITRKSRLQTDYQNRQNNQIVKHNLSNQNQIHYIPVPVFQPQYIPERNQKYQMSQSRVKKQKQSNFNNMNYLEKLLTLKDEENKKLLQLLQNQNNKNLKISKASTISAENKFQVPRQIRMHKQTEKDLLPEERVLISLQKQELDELRLLSSLPEQLQKLKFESIKNASEIRMKIEKQIQQQRLMRMKYQMEKQYQEEERLYKNQLWIDNQRKKDLQQKLTDELE